MRKLGKSASMCLCSAAIILLAFSLNVGCGGDDDDNPAGTVGTYVPEAWVGVWEETGTQTICGETTPFSTYTDTTTYCPDEEDWETDGSETTVCDYTWDGSTMSATCTTDTTMGECTVSAVHSYTGTVTGTNYSIIGTITNVYSGNCSTDLPTCINVALSGTRIGDAPDPCDPYSDPEGDTEALSYTVANGASVDYSFSNIEVIVSLNQDGSYNIGVGTIGGDFLGFTTPASTAPNNYGLAEEGATSPIGVTYTMSDGSVLNSATGTMLVTAADASHIAGTFSFTAIVSDGSTSENLVFSDGVFDLLVDGTAKKDQLPVSARAFRARLLGMIR